MQDVVEITATAITSGDLKMFSTPARAQLSSSLAPGAALAPIAPYVCIFHFDHDATAEEHDVR